MQAAGCVVCTGKLFPLQRNMSDTVSSIWHSCSDSESY